MKMIRRWSRTIDGKPRYGWRYESTDGIPCALTAALAVNKQNGLLFNPDDKIDQWLTVTGLPERVKVVVIVADATNGICVADVTTVIQQTQFMWSYWGKPKEVQSWIRMFFGDVTLDDGV